MSLYSTGLLVATALVAVIWFAFIAPSERRYHEKKLQLLQERIEKRRQYLQEEAPEQLDDAVSSADGKAKSDAEQ
jgi:hypothetical protein